MRSAIPAFGLLLVAGPLVGQDRATLAVRHFSPAVVEIRDEGRLLGRTPAALRLPSGVHRLRIAGTPHCVYLEPRATAELVIAAGEIQSLTGAVGCAEMWSELLIRGVPADVMVGASSGSVSRRGGNVAVRVDVPGIVRINATGARHADLSRPIRVGPSERQVLRLDMGPTRPPLIEDSILVEIPPRPERPTMPARVPPPVDPTVALARAQTNLSLMRSAERWDGASTPGAIIAGIGLVGTLVTGLVVAADTAKKRPEWRDYLKVSLGVTGAGFVLSFPPYMVARNRSARAGCDESPGEWNRCIAGFESDVERLRLDLERFPQRYADWERAEQERPAAYEAALADYERRLTEWEELVAELEARNEAIRENRAENERRLTAWRAELREVDRLELVERGPRR